jgi:hypothetical protein
VSDNSPRFWYIRWAVLVAGLLACAPSPAGAQLLDSWPWPWSGDPAGLHLLSVSELDDLYRQSTIHAMPYGNMPGEVVAFANVPVPQLFKRVANNHWKGKIIEPDGSFVNQFKKRQALHSCLTIGPSYLDGQPCFICEYPRFTPLFGPMRDEYREIAPGVFLGRQYRRVPHVRFLGYNVLRLCSGGYMASEVLQQVAPVPLSGTTVLPADVGVMNTFPAGPQQIPAVGADYTELAPLWPAQGSVEGKRTGWIRSGRRRSHETGGW